MRKKIPDQIKYLLQNVVQSHHRGIIIIVGDKAIYQVANLFHFYCTLHSGKKPNVLWCFKKKLSFSQREEKNLKKLEDNQNKGLVDREELKAFELFFNNTDIRKCKYEETQGILGNTFGMLILQDFEAITPNVLCRTIETVQGGGLVFFLFNKMSNLEQLHEMVMDVHSKYITSSSNELQPRFNKRFIASITKDCLNAVAIDHELNILNVMRHKIEAKADEVDINLKNSLITKRAKELKDLQDSFEGQVPMSVLVGICKTLDQAKVVMGLLDKLQDKHNTNVVSITAGRGRGKSAALGIAVGAAFVYGYSSIYVTAPSAENLKTFFEFIIITLKSLKFTEHKDFSIKRGDKENTRDSIVRIEVFRDNRKSITYVEPQDSLVASYGELLIIDEAAALPLNLVKALIGNSTVFLASTVQGYEGTGRSLSLKLIKQLQQGTLKGGNLTELKLEQAIRYSDGDPIEDWLNKLLCLNCQDSSFPDLPSPDMCELYLVNRNTLFAYLEKSEEFLNMLMNLFVSSHYKNSPNDLQMLSDAPRHDVFVLTKNIDHGTKQLPDILCAIQVAREGGIEKETTVNNNRSSIKPSGDLIAWTLNEFFQDDDFPSLEGIRVVRIATHPKAQSMGYGTRALQLLEDFYSGKMVGLDFVSEEKKGLGPILRKLTETRPPKLSYLGVSFGLNEPLFKFWKRSAYVPVFIKLTENDVTGENTCILLKEIENENVGANWLVNFKLDFSDRFVHLLPFHFRQVTCKLAQDILKMTIGNRKSVMDEDETVV